MSISRRRILRGVLDGAKIVVALPLLDCFLDGNGAALAGGRPIPVRFGTWFWGLGGNAPVFIPKKTGADYDLPEEIASWASVRQHINLISGLTAFRDTDPNLCHYTGWIINMTGQSPKSAGDKPGETFDTTISNQIGRTTRFRSLHATATGDVRSTVSYENANAPAVPEVSPLNLYTRLFGPDFQDPNVADFKPNPRVLVRKSVLSGVMDETKAMSREIGAEDRQRLEQYMTGLRQLEHQFDQQLSKPEPIEACVRPKAPAADPELGTEAETVRIRHQMMTDLLVMAVACDQTRVFNMSYSAPFANTSKAGYEKPHHTTTHEEPVDPALGYQDNCSWFTRRAMESWADYVEAFSKVREGDGTLLDNMLIYASTDTGYARFHALEGICAMTAGRAGGKVKSGVHVKAEGQTIARLGYTIQRVMGLDIDSWGARSNKTSKEFGEILA